MRARHTESGPPLKPTTTRDSSCKRWCWRMKIRTFSNTSLIIRDKIRQKNAPLQKNPSFYFVLFKKCPTFAPAIGNKPPHGALDEWLSQRSAKPCTPVRIGYAPPKKKTQPFKLSLFCLKLWGRIGMWIFMLVQVNCVGIGGDLLEEWEVFRKESHVIHKLSVPLQRNQN